MANPQRTQVLPLGDTLHASGRSPPCTSHRH
eukprot:CAMPEP_0178408146 /NCGR_PEP_ID=MMETSP0689_2-20121128/19789_1 /TAXON_ID=160604 /ORGANISM="Amphidinium massartii, Strain CS-259" /LENGTH=30 /DNA_ID= /DNA_START= /DNA_END= /DNA_ORIENTATION=